MEKHIEENPNDIDREDDVRINKNDISKKKKNLIGFVAQEQVPSTEFQGAFSPDQDLEGVSEEVVENQEFGYIEKLDKKEQAEKLRNEIINFHQGEGVASVGPDVEGGLVGEGGEEFKSLDIDPAASSANLDSISVSKTVEYDQARKFHKLDKDKAAGHDNRKTITDSKKERSFGKRVKDFIFGQNNEDTPQAKLEQMIDSYPLDREYEDPTLNDRPMDKRFLDDENKAA